jgi:hypothetical protein
VILTNPITAFETRNTGHTTEHAADLNGQDNSKKKARKKTVTYTAATDLRVWKGANGSIISARLLAFERTTPGGDTLLPLIRDDKVRLLVHGAKQVSLIPLASLSTGDQVFIQNLVAVRRAAASPTAVATAE